MGGRVGGGGAWETSEGSGAQQFKQGRVAFFLWDYLSRSAEMLCTLALPGASHFWIFVLSRLTA